MTAPAFVDKSVLADFCQSRFPSIISTITHIYNDIYYIIFTKALPVDCVDELGKKKGTLMDNQNDLTTGMNSKEVM